MLIGPGVDPERLEMQLSTFFQRAEDWNAIILMDECEMYISSRDPSYSIEKNAMVNSRQLKEKGNELN